jgi:hypothetical protein
MSKKMNIKLSAYVLLNALGIFTSFGQVCENSGIGTITPTSKLHIKGCGNASASSSLHVMNLDSKPLFYVRDDGNIGLNTIIPGAQLQIDHVYNAAGQGLYLNQPVATWGTVPLFNSYRYIQTGALATDGNVKAFHVGPGGVTIGYPNTPVYGSGDALYVNGQVGVGTSTPLHPVHVESAAEWGMLVRSSNSTAAIRNNILIQRSNANTAVTSNYNLGGISIGGFDGTNFGSGWNGGAEIMAYSTQSWTSTAKGTALVFATTANGSAGDTERMRIDHSGNVGIATATPGSLLSIANGVDDPTNYGKAVQITNLNGRSQQMAFIRSGNNVIAAGYHGSTSYWGFGAGQPVDANFAPNYLSFDAINGFVGVGNAAPATLLHVNRGDYAAIYLGNNALTGHHITHEPSDNSLVFWSGLIGSGTPRIKLTASGNVGIGSGLNAIEDVLQFGGGAYKGVMGSASGANLGYGTTYFALNASRQTGTTWSTSSDGSNNGGVIMYGNIFGDLRFSSIPSTGAANQSGITDATIAANTRLVIQSGGNIGIGTLMPQANARLAVKDGHFQSQQTTLITSITVNGGGTGSMSNATDIAGKISLTPTITTTTATFTFSKTYSSPIVVLTPTNAAAAAEMSTAKIFVTTTVGSPTTCTINFGAAPTTAVKTFNYMVIETQ